MAATVAMGLPNVASVACQYVIPPHLCDPGQHDNLVQIFQDAVGRTITHHPLGQVGIIDPESRKPSWGVLHSLELTSLISWRLLGSAEDYGKVRQELVKSQLDTKFFTEIGSQPGWRVHVLHEPSMEDLEVFFIFSHAHFDGMSASIFHEQLLAQLNKSTQRGRRSGVQPFQAKATILATANPYNFPPPLESMAYWPTSTLHRASSLLKKLTHSFLLPAPPSGDDDHPPPETGIKTLNVPQHVVQGLMTCSHFYPGATVTSLLHVLTAVSLARQIPKDKFPAAIKNFWAFSACTDVNNPLLTLPDYESIYPNTTMANISAHITQKFQREGLLLSEVKDHPDLALVTSMAALSIAGDDDDDDAESGERSASKAEPAKQAGERGEKPRIAGGEPLPRDLKELIWSTAADYQHDFKARRSMGLRTEDLGIGPTPNNKTSKAAAAEQSKLSAFVISDLFDVDSEESPPTPSFSLNNWKSQLARDLSQQLGMHDADSEKEEWIRNKEYRWEIKRASYILPAGVTSAGIHLGVIGVTEGDTVINLTWLKGSFDDNVVETLAEDLEGWLRSFSKGKEKASRLVRAPQRPPEAGTHDPVGQPPSGVGGSRLRFLGG